MQPDTAGTTTPCSVRAGCAGLIGSGHFSDICEIGSVAAAGHR